MTVGLQTPSVLDVRIEGLGKETNAVLADRGALTLPEWPTYSKALLKANDDLLQVRLTELRQCGRKYVVSDPVGETTPLDRAVRIVGLLAAP